MTTKIKNHIYTNIHKNTHSSTAAYVFLLARELLEPEDAEMDRTKRERLKEEQEDSGK